MIESIKAIKNISMLRIITVYFNNCFNLLNKCDKIIEKPLSIASIKYE
jgi:hypothetical protein